MKGRFFLIVCLIIALYLAFVFANYNQHYHFTLPTFNLKSVSALAASINQAQPQAAQAAGSYSVVGSPTISAAFIDKVLASVLSPAAGTGAILYTLGVKYGIDPVFALAFFQHESDYGTAGMARTTRSLGNLRCTAGYACYKGYAAFPCWQAGYEA